MRGGTRKIRDIKGLTQTATSGEGSGGDTIAMEEIGMILFYV